MMPKLKHLHISLSVEEDVSYIMEKLTSLESLNGIHVETQSNDVGSPKEDSPKEDSPFQESPVAQKQILDKEYILA